MTSRPAGVCRASMACSRVASGPVGRRKDRLRQSIRPHRWACSSPGPRWRYPHLPCLIILSASMSHARASGYRQVGSRFRHPVGRLQSNEGSGPYKPSSRRSSGPGGPLLSSRSCRPERGPAIEDRPGHPGQLVRQGHYRLVLVGASRQLANPAPEAIVAPMGLV